MYASVADYTSIYDATYRARRGEHVSFDPTNLPPLIHDLCATLGLHAVLDVSGGQGTLCRTLREGGLHALATDFQADAARAVMPLDLAGADPSAVAGVRAAAAELAGGGAHLTSCLDVLEHIDPEHIGHALGVLEALTDRYLLVSISTRPSSRGNRFHPCVRPLSTWMLLFEAAGFRQRTDLDAPFRPTARRAETGITGDRVVDAWRAADPFDDIRQGEPRYVVLERANAIVADLGAAAARLLDIAYRATKRAQFGASPGRVVLVLHHVQEWSFLRALLDVLPRRDVLVLCRGLGVFAPWIAGALDRTGVRHRFFESYADLPWEEIAGATVITAAESGAAASHVVAQGLVARAALHGCRTVLLQHGLWPRPFADRVVSFLSDHVVTWGSADSRILSQPHRIGAAVAPWGVLPSEQEVRIGSPRYSDQLMPFPDGALTHRLGLPPGRFARTALLCLKRLPGSEWVRGQSEDRFFNTLATLAAEHPDTLFLLRPHPSYDPSLRFPLHAGNVRQLDEANCIAADLPLSRVLPLVDVVITPQSTVALDGGVSGKPVLIYDTRGDLPYPHMQPTAFDAIRRALDDPTQLAEAKSQAVSLAEDYAGSVDLNFYAQFATLLRRPAPPRPLDRLLATTISLSAEVEGQAKTARTAHDAAVALADTMREARARQAEAEREASAAHAAAALAYAERHAAERLATLAQTSLLAVEAQLRAMRASSSWRVTAPMRTIAQLVKRGLAGRKETR